MIYDLVIVGGGMVGAALACALEDTDFRIAIIDANTPASTEDPRLIALNYSSYCLLKNLKIWPQLSEHAAKIKEVHVSTRGRFGTTRIEAKELNLDALGFVAPAKEINIALYSQLQKIKNVEIFFGAKLISLTQTENNVSLEIESNNSTHLLVAKKVIAADGTHSTIRELLQIQTETINYKQS